MKRIVALGVVLWGAISAHAATSFSVVGNWSNYLQPACSNTGATAASCSAAAPGSPYVVPDGHGGYIGGTYLSGSEDIAGIGNPYTSSRRVVVEGQIELSAGGWGNTPDPAQPIVTLKGTLDLPSQWSDVNVYAYVHDSTDQYSSPYEQGWPDSILLTSSDGQNVMAKGNTNWTPLPDLSGIFTHSAGTPFSVNWSQMLSCCETINSSDHFSFDLVFTGSTTPDPVLSDAPEPSSYLLFGTGLVLLAPSRKLLAMVRRTHTRT